MNTNVDRLYSGASGWGEKTMDHASGIWGREPVFNYLRKIIKSGDTVLDLGSGAGVPSSRLAEMVGLSGSVFGIERNSSMISKARESFKDIPNIYFIDGDITETLPDINADVVVSFMVLHNLVLADVIKVFSNIAQVLKENGRAVLLTMHHQALESDWDMNFIAYNQEDLGCFKEAKDKEGIQVRGTVKNSSGGEKAVMMFNHTLKSIQQAIKSVGFQLDNELDLWIDQKTAEKKFGHNSVRRVPTTPTFWMLDISRGCC